MNKKVLILLIALFLLAGKVYALGVSPGKTTINFQPNLERVVELTILNNEKKDLSIAVNADGELSKYISFDEKDINLSQSEGSKTIKYRIKMPESISRPGLHETNIVLRETKSVTGEGIKIGTSISVISVLNLKVPYEGKYVEVNLFAIELNKNEIMFVVEVTNLGEKDIDKATATIDIFEGNKKITTLITDEKPVKQNIRRELTAKWKIETPGEYKAKAKINYDEKIIESETKFNTKGFFIKIIDIAVKNFKLGDIAKFKILLENIANKESKEVFTKMSLNDETGKNIMDIESQRKSIESKKRKELQAYWDTETIKKGNYNGKIIVYSNEEKWETPMSMDVEETSIKTRIGPTGMAITETKSGYKTLPLIGILMIALIGVNIGWYMYTKKIRKL